MSVTIAGDGTTEAAWRPWLAEQTWPDLDLAAVAGRRVVVLAAHPDDEVLAIGGLLRALNLLGARLTFVWASAGEASHPDSRSPVVGTMAALRRVEALEALIMLGVRRCVGHEVGLPDSGVAAHPAALDAALDSVLDGAGPAVLLAPWRSDGHPDHDACGRAAAEVAARRGADLLEYPVWAWHWARPGDPRLPWSRAFRVPLDPAARLAKAAAVASFVTQVAPIGPAPEDAAVLSPAVLQRFARGAEVVFR